MMDQFEKVEKLREHADVSYEEAKDALEKSNWDILDAMIYLEQNGKTKAPERESYTTNGEKTGAKAAQETEREDKDGFWDAMHRFGDWCIKWINKGNSNQFAIYKDGEETFSVPITLLVVLLLFAFYVVVPLIVVGLFFNFRYHFEGPDMRAVDLNKAMDTAADAAENLKNDINHEINK